MILIVEKEISATDYQTIETTIASFGATTMLTELPTMKVVHVVGTLSDEAQQTVANCQGVVRLQKMSHSYHLVSREFKETDTIVDVDGVKIGGDAFVTMAGPCAVENEAQLFASAALAKKGGAQILRGGAYKPRTSPYTFQGLGEEGLRLLRRAADQYDMKVITEVMDESQLALVAKYSDILQIGARNMQNFALLKAVGQTGKPVALKRGLSATIDEWLNAGEYIAQFGKSDVIFVERGIRTYEQATRNTFDVSSVPLLQQLTHYPVIVDPSHATGDWRLVTPMARAGVAAGASGMIVEIHPNPDEAWSDGPQSLKEDTYLQMMAEVNVMTQAMQQIRALQGGNYANCSSTK